MREELGPGAVREACRRRRFAAASRDVCSGCTLHAHTRVGTSTLGMGKRRGGLGESDFGGGAVITSLAREWTIMVLVIRRCVENGLAAAAVVQSCRRRREADSNRRGLRANQCHGPCRVPAAAAAVGTRSEQCE